MPEPRKLMTSTNTGRGTSDVLPPKHRKDEEMNENLILIMLVAIGGAVGAVLRFSVTLAMPPMEGIAWNTLIVNLVGCALITLLFYGVDMDTNTRIFLITGVLGGFTTMSAVSLETMDLYVTGALGPAVANLVLNVSACVGGGVIGRLIAMMIT